MRVPKHIGIIPDGNRRWATEHGKEKGEGYQFGLKPGLDAVSFARDLGVEEITYYGFTTDNCKRPKQQQEGFIQACVDAVALVEQDPVSLLVVGNMESKLFPQELKSYETRVDKHGGGIKVNFLVNYGWEWDLSQLEDTGSNRGKIMDTLQSREISRMDLIIRWGGMRRLSGFLPVQSVYADFYVCDALWPDFQQEQMKAALDWYQKQDVTLGG